MGKGEGNSTNGGVLEGFQAVARLHLLRGGMNSLRHKFHTHNELGKSNSYLNLDTAWTSPDTIQTKDIIQCMKEAWFANDASAISITSSLFQLNFPHSFPTYFPIIQEKNLFFHIFIQRPNTRQQLQSW